MSRDTRTYISLHDGIVDHPKVGPLPDGAFRLYIETLCWCSRHLTDGRILAASWGRMGTPAARRALISAGLIEVDGENYAVHDYLKHQRSADEVAEMRAKRAEAGRRGGLATAKQAASKGAASAAPSATALAKQTVQQNGSKSAAVSVSVSDVVQNPSRKRSDEPDGFVEFWLAYPRKTAKPAAIRAYRTAMKDSDPAVILAAASRYARERRGQDKTYTAHPATWLNGRRWEDEAPKPRSVNEWENYTTFSDFDSKGRPTRGAG